MRKIDPVFECVGWNEIERATPFQYNHRHCRRDHPTDGVRHPSPAVLGRVETNVRVGCPKFQPPQPLSFLRLCVEQGF